VSRMMGPGKTIMFTSDERLPVPDVDDVDYDFAVRKGTPISTPYQYRANN